MVTTTCATKEMRCRSIRQEFDHLFGGAVTVCGATAVRMRSSFSSSESMRPPAKSSRAGRVNGQGNKGKVVAAAAAAAVAAKRRRLLVAVATAGCGGGGTGTGF